MINVFNTHRETIEIYCENNCFDIAVGQNIFFSIAGSPVSINVTQHVIKNAEQLNSSIKQFTFIEIILTDNYINS